MDRRLASLVPQKKKLTADVVQPGSGNSAWMVRFSPAHAARLDGILASLESRWEARMQWYIKAGLLSKTSASAFRTFRPHAISPS